MRITIVTLLKNRAWGGSENLWFKAAILALENGHKILVVADQTLDSKNLNVLKNLGAEIFFLENHLTSYKERIFQFFNPSFAEKKFGQDLSNRIGRFNPDLLLINQPGCYDITFNKITADFLKLTAINYVICFHSYTNDEVLTDSEKALMRNILLRASANFFVAKKQAATILQQLKVDLKYIFFIFNPLNLNDKSALPYPSAGNIKLAMVGSLDIKWKGHDIVLNILSKHEWREEDWSLSIFGQGPDFEKIKELIARYNLTDRVELKGQVSDIRQIWETHHILLMPSRVDAAPAVLLEAMACGRTAICADIGFVEDWIENEVSGFIADINLFESAFKNAWIKRNNWENMGNLASKRIHHAFPEKPEKEFLEQLISLA